MRPSSTAGTSRQACALPRTTWTARTPGRRHRLSGAPRRPRDRTGRPRSRPPAALPGSSALPSVRLPEPHEEVLEGDRIDVTADRERAARAGRPTREPRHGRRGRRDFGEDVTLGPGFVFRLDVGGVLGASRAPLDEIALFLQERDERRRSGWRHADARTERREELDACPGRDALRAMRRPVQRQGHVALADRRRAETIAGDGGDLDSRDAPAQPPSRDLVQPGYPYRAKRPRLGEHVAQGGPAIEDPLWMEHQREELLFLMGPVKDRPPRRALRLRHERKPLDEDLVVGNGDRQ